jgi:hypothetical protein
MEEEEHRVTPGEEEAFERTIRRVRQEREDVVRAMVEALNEAPAFAIEGAQGYHAQDINGIFKRTDEVVNDAPVFMKVGNGGLLCCW